VGRITIDRLTVVAVLLLLVPVLFCLFLVEGGATDYRSAPLAFVAIALVKVASLIAAAWFAWRSSQVAGEDNSARAALLALGLGYGAYASAQLVLTLYQMSGAEAAPFPSLADPLFVLATFALIAALCLLLVCYHRAGLLVGQLPVLVLAAVISIVVLTTIVTLVLMPTLKRTMADRPALERLLVATYPILDAILLVPTAGLFAVAFNLWGGALRRIFVTLLAGFALMAIGDLVFPLFATLDIEALGALLDLVFGGAYVLMARAAAEQYELLRPGAV
jgi:hypothetical protein